MDVSLGGNSISCSAGVVGGDGGGEGVDGGGGGTVKIGGVVEGGGGGGGGGGVTTESVDFVCDPLDAYRTMLTTAGKPGDPTTLAGLCRSFGSSTGRQYNTEEVLTG